MTGRVLVTGGCGFIGVHLVAALVHGAWRVTVLDDESAGARAELGRLPVKYAGCDIRDAEGVTAAMAGQDAVVHLAARPDVASALDDPGATHEINVRGTINVLEAARRHAVGHVVAASSGGTVIGRAGAPVHEATAPRPLSPLGASKAAMEAYLHAYASSYGVATCAARLANVYGPGGRHKASAVLRFLRQWRDGEPVSRRGDGSQSRDFVYVADVVEGICRILDRGAQGVFQIGSGTPTSLDALLAQIARTCGRTPAAIRPEPALSGEVHTTYCDISRARTELGFAPATALPDGLAATWRWVRDGEPLGDAIRRPVAVATSLVD